MKHIIHKSILTLIAFCGLAAAQEALQQAPPGKPVPANPDPVLVAETPAEILRQQAREDKWDATLEAAMNSGNATNVALALSKVVTGHKYSELGVAYRKVDMERDVFVQKLHREQSQLSELNRLASFLPEGSEPIPETNKPEQIRQLVNLISMKDAELSALITKAYPELLIAYQAMLQTDLSEDLNPSKWEPLQEIK